MKFNTKCTFTCPLGYQLQGPSFKQCKADGQWTDRAKTISCVGEFLMNYPDQKPDSVLFTFDFLQTIASNLLNQV